MGVAGHGVDDAPSLIALSISIILGSESDIATAAADMVLLGSFGAVVDAVKHGRALFNNVGRLSFTFFL